MSRRLTILPESSETLIGKQETFTNEEKFFNCFGSAFELPLSNNTVCFRMKLGKQNFHLLPDIISYILRLQYIDSCEFL